MESSQKKRIAIVGSGVAGIAAAWALKDSGHEVHIYEAADRLGGHTNTVDFKHGKFKTAVDTGFIVLNTATYPNFINFLKTINVPTKPTEMTFAVSRDAGLFEWSGTNPLTLFAQPSNLFSPSFWRMLFDIFRFNQYALDLLINSPDSDNASSTTSGHALKPEEPEESIGKYLEREGYSDAFRDDYLIPMTAAVWSTSPDRCSLEFPAVTLVRFLWNHHLLTTIGARPQWLTLPLGSKSYIDAALADFPKERIHLKTPISKISPRGDGRLVITHPGSDRNQVRTEEIFDKVILCTHAPTSLKIIKPHATPAEKQILGSFSTSPNTAVLHSDISLLPERRLAWAAWNYLTLSNSPKAGEAAMSKIKGSRNIDQVCLTYNMNILQHIPTDVFGDVLVTLNPLHRPAEGSIQGEYRYEHPLYTVKAMEAQKRLEEIQNERGVLYAGAWTKYGFHEDGFSSGLEAAMKLGAEVPFEYKDSRYSRGRKPVLGKKDYLLRLWLWGMMKVFGLLARILNMLGLEGLVGLTETNGRPPAMTNGKGKPSWAYIGSEDSFDEEMKKDL